MEQRRRYRNPPIEEALCEFASNRIRIGTPLFPASFRPNLAMNIR